LQITFFFFFCFSRKGAFKKLITAIAVIVIITSWWLHLSQSLGGGGGRPAGKDCAGTTGDSCARAGNFPKGPGAPCLVWEIWPSPLYIQNKQMINCFISDCAGRHTTHIPAGSAVKIFILFNNKSKTNVAFHPAACLYGVPHTKTGRGSGAHKKHHHLAGRISAGRKEGGKKKVGAGPPSCHFRPGVRMGVGIQG
jgi:hypothetical protein